MEDPATPFGTPEPDSSDLWQASGPNDARISDALAAMRQAGDAEEAALRKWLEDPFHGE